MKIACVDKTAAARGELRESVDSAFEQCRHSIGHVSFAQTYPASKDEVLINSRPDAVVIGPKFPLEMAFAACKEISQAHPSTPIVCVLAPDIYSLRVLRRFENLTDEVLTTEDSPLRLVHRLTSSEHTHHSNNTGKLIVANGVKGGVGTTSIVSGLAHAAEALGKTAVVIDLSPSAAFAQYMKAERWQSPDFAAMLSEHIPPEQDTLNRCLTTAANGITLMLSPAGGSEIRELWLRDAHTFETTLAAIDILKESFDFIIVDTAHSEGVLTFALNTRADSRLLISSNDPASVHLLNSELSNLAELPGSSCLHILINMLSHQNRSTISAPHGGQGLSTEDIMDFLYLNDHFDPIMAMLKAVPFDERGHSWIGTGNSFYTESSKSVQKSLESSLLSFLLSKQELKEGQERESAPFEGIKRFVKGLGLSRINITDQSPAHSTSSKPQALSPPQAGSHHTHQAFPALEYTDNLSKSQAQCSETITKKQQSSKSTQTNISPEQADTKELSSSTYLYHSPQLVEEEVQEEPTA